MKNLFYFFACLFLVVGCQSKEDKANKLIDEYMFKHLHDYKSYEVVETKVDTLYNTPLFDSECIKAAILMKEHDEKADEYDRAASRNKSTMDIWSGGWSSTAREEFKEAFDDYRNNMRLEVIEKQASLRAWKTIAERCMELNGEEMIGWLVEHSYRCNNRGGNSVLSSKVFLIDKKFKTIISSYDSDEDFDYAIKQIGTTMNDEDATPEHFDSLIAQYDELLEKLSNDK